MQTLAQAFHPSGFTGEITCAGGPSGPDPAFLSALNQELGLKLEPQRALLEVLVIDHAEQPKDN
jgi:uncharacterized protein (TIGR03435 family)